MFDPIKDRAAITTDAKTMTVRQIAEKWDCSHSVVRKYLKMWRVVPCSYVGVLSFDDERKVRSMVTTHTITQLSREFGVGVSTIQSIVNDEVDTLNAIIELEGYNVMKMREFYSGSEVNGTTVLTSHRRPCYVVIPFDEWVGQQESRR